MLSHRLPERTQVTGIENIDDLKDVLFDHEVDFEAWGTPEQPKSNSPEKLLNHLIVGGYTLWLTEGGSLMRQCDTIRGYVTMPGEGVGYVLREVYKQKLDGSQKRKWAIESTMGERRERVTSTGEMETDTEMIERAVREELGLGTNPHMGVNEITPEGLYIVRESPSFPGLANVFRFTDAVLDVRSEDPQAVEGFYDPETVSEIVDEEGGTIVGWGWDKILSEDDMFNILLNMGVLELNEGEDIDNFEYPESVLPISFAKKAVQDEVARIKLKDSVDNGLHIYALMQVEESVIQDAYAERFLQQS